MFENIPPLLLIVSLILYISIKKLRNKNKCQHDWTAASVNDPIDFPLMDPYQNDLRNWFCIKCYEKRMDRDNFLIKKMTQLEKRKIADKLQEKERIVESEIHKLGKDGQIILLEEYKPFKAFKK